MSVQETIVNWLFETRAIRVSPPGQPFWYASGTLGPYYVNTHFLYGSEREANELLSLIESGAGDPLTLPGKIATAVQRQYRENALYHDLCDLIATWLRASSGDLISGGERRDFFFSVPAAILLDKPHLSIMKNGTAIWSNRGFTGRHIAAEGELVGLQAIHVSDLVTEASSYQRAWLPVLHRCGATLPLTLTVIDRDQGGREWLASAGTELLALTRIDRPLFELAEASGLIDAAQLKEINRFIDDPLEFLRHFLAEHPDYIRQQLALGGKNRERALLCLEKGYAGPV